MPRCCLSKVLHNLLSTVTQTALGQFESDATACFDRIVMNFALACFRSSGAPMGPLRMWEQTLYHIVHQVKTVYGLSEASYQYSDASPTIGPGQGSRGGPAACSTTTSPLLEAMDKLCHGVQFLDPSQSRSYTATANMFVDDASNSTNQFLRWLHESPDPPDVVSLLQHDAQTWERLLYTSGGLLNITKCLYYISCWKFDSEGLPSPVPKLDIQPPLTLTSGVSTDPTPVPHHNFDEAHRYLGDWLSVNMQMTTAFQKLSESGRKYSTRLLTSPLSKRDAWIAYFAVFFPAITYTFAVTHHSPKTLRTLQSGLTRATLLKLGFNRNTPLAVVYGPSLHGALALRNLPIEQGIVQLQMLIRHVRATLNMALTAVLRSAFFSSAVNCFRCRR
jgi:hypothetical protein